MQHIKKVLLMVSVFSIVLGHSQTSELIRVPGEVTGYQDLSRDGEIDGAIVLPTLRAGDLLSFQMDQLIGPNEEMRIGPITVELPSNFHLPRQRERIGFLPVTLKKEEFGLYLRPIIYEELSAISFKAPFDELMDIAQQDNVPFTRMLALIDVQKLGYLEDRDWTQEQYVDMPLNQDLNRIINYRWDRLAPPAHESDHLFAFQETPLGRWTISDLVGDVTARGQLRMTSSLNDASKLLFLRTEESDDMTYAQGYLRAAQAGDQVLVQGAPEKLEASLEPSGRINWSPISEQGWMMVAVERKEDGVLTNFMKLFSSFHKMLRSTQQTLQLWADPSLGELELGVGSFENDAISVVFIGTDRAVSVPLPGEDNPELFEAAQEIRMRKLQ